MSIRTFRVHPVAVVSITACLRHAVAGGNPVSASFRRCGRRRTEFGYVILEHARQAQSTKIRSRRTKGVIILIV